MTFSLLAFDPHTQEIGSGVVSKWTAVGNCVPFFRAGLGLFHVQNYTFAPLAREFFSELKTLSQAERPEALLQKSLQHALERVPHPEQRQCLAATFDGSLFAFTGEHCSPPAMHKQGATCIAAGNTLRNSAVVQETVAAYETNNHLPLAERLLLALEAGQKAGGDRRGQEAAAIKVFSREYPQQDLLPIDLRIASHHEPLPELRRLYERWIASPRQMMGDFRKTYSSRAASLWSKE